MVLNCNLWGVVVRLIRKYLNRFVPVICVLAILVSCLAAPAAASSIESYNDTGLLYYDLLQSNEYAFLPNDRVETFPFSNFYAGNVTRVINVVFPYSGSAKFNKVVFAISSNQKPSAAFFNGVSAALDDFIDISTDNDIYFYSIY